MKIIEKIREKLDKSILKKYELESYDRKKRMEFLIYMNSIMLAIFIFSIIVRIFIIPNPVVIIGYSFGVLCIFLSLFSIYQNRASQAVYFYISIIISLFLFYPFLIQDTILDIKEIFQLVALETTTILLTGLVAIEKKQIIIHGIFCIIIFLYNSIVIVSISINSTEEKVFYTIIPFFLVLISFWGSFQIYNSFEKLIQLAKKEYLDKTDALTKIISGYIPICASCKSIRKEGDDNNWIVIEEFIQHKSNDVEFTHGLCPMCMDKLYPEFSDKTIK